MSAAVYVVQRADEQMEARTVDRASGFRVPLTETGVVGGSPHDGVSEDGIVDKWENADRLLDLYNLVPEEWRSEKFDPDLDQMDRLIESLTPFLDDRSSA